MRRPSASAAPDHSSNLHGSSHHSARRFRRRTALQSRLCPAVRLPGILCRRLPLLCRKPGRAQLPTGARRPRPCRECSLLPVRSAECRRLFSAARRCLSRACCREPRAPAWGRSHAAYRRATAGRANTEDEPRSTQAKNHPLWHTHPR